LSSGRVSFNFYAVYCVSKYGVEVFSDALRREMYPWGINVSIMEPGGFQTGITEPRTMEKQMRQGWVELSDEMKEYGKEHFEKCRCTFPLANGSHFLQEMVALIIT